jgi:tetraacyldisaccharide 4'-kinase
MWSPVVSVAWERVWYPREPEPALRQLALAPLAAASWAFGAAVRVRNALYDRGTLQATRIEGVRVVSVGNLTVGGAGKTPAVMYLARRWSGLGRKVAVLSRGYGRRTSLPLRVRPETTVADAGDEPVLIARRCPDVAVWVGADRAVIAQRAREEGASLLLLDDGMQHRGLARDAEIVVVDAAVTFGNGWLLPRGPLREPLAGLRRAHLVWRFGDADRGTLACWDVPTVQARTFAVSVRDAMGNTQPLSWLSGRRVLLLSGIARPERFRRTAEAAGAQVVADQVFADHHTFGVAELDRIGQRARTLGVPVVTTEKDQVRLPSGFAAHAVQLDVELASGAEGLDALLGDR